MEQRCADTAYTVPYSLVLVLAIAFVVRLLAATTEPLYVDEAFTCFMGKANLQTIVSAARLDAHPPTYYILCHWWLGLGSSTLWLRFPAIVFSLGSILLAHRIAWSLCPPSGPDREQAALGTSILMALSYSSWHGETLIRANALFELIMLVFLWDLTRYRDVDSKPWRWTLLAYPLAPMLNLLGIVPVACLSLLYPSRGRSRLGQLLAVAVSVLLSAAWIFHTSSSSALREERLPSSGQFFNPAWFTFPGDVFGLSLPGSLLHSELFGPYLAWFSFLAGPLICLGCGWKVCRFVLKRERAGLAGLAFFIPWGALIALSLLRGGWWYQTRYLGPYVFGLYFVAVMAALQLGKPGARILLGLWIGVQVLTWLSFLSGTYYWNQDWPQVAKFFRRHQKGLGGIFVYHHFNVFGLAYYFYDKPDVVFRDDGVWLKDAAKPGAPALLEVRPRSFGTEQLEPFRGQRVGIVLCQEADLGVRQLFSANTRIVDGLQLGSINSWGNIEAYVVEVNPREP